MTNVATESGVRGWLRLRPGTERRILWVGLAVVALAAIAFPLVNKYWPFRYRNVKPLLETVFASKITIASYHRIYFPHPGFVAEGLTMRRNTATDLPPIGSAQALTVEGSWLDLLMLRRHVLLVDVQGMHVVIPAPGSRANHEDFPAGSSADFVGPTTTVDKLHLLNSTFDIMREDGGRYSYPIRELTMRHVRSGQASSYAVDMQNAMPTGHILAKGSFGPLTPSNLGGTPLSGDFTFTQVKLSEIGELKGTLAAKGHFSGSLVDIETTATTETPDFAVSDGRPVEVAGAVQCTVNGLTSDVVMHTIEVKTGSTVVHAGGSVMGSPKVTEMQMDVEKGRAEDLLQPFLKDRPPVVGVVWLKGRAHISPADHGAKFLQRLQVDGGFNVPAQRLTDQAAGKSLTAFSARAQGAGSDQGQAGDPQTSSADVVSSLEGQVKIRNGVMSTERLTFGVPGASADLKGTYNFHGGAVHMTGNLKMESDISHAATGFKSVLLKPLAPFFKKKKVGAEVAVAVTGAPGHYQVTQNILHTK